MDRSFVEIRSVSLGLAILIKILMQFNVGIVLTLFWKIESLRVVTAPHEENLFVFVSIVRLLPLAQIISHSFYFQRSLFTSWNSYEQGVDAENVYG